MHLDKLLAEVLGHLHGFSIITTIAAQVGNPGRRFGALIDEPHTMRHLITSAANANPIPAASPASP